MASPALTHFLPRFGVAAAVAGVLSLTGCQTWNTQDTLPPTTGVQPLKGLAQNVSVRRNAMGMPLIESNTFHDALFTLGYVHATDRITQMVTLRLLAQGRLSEMSGSDLLDADRYMRAVNLKKSAGELYKASSPRLKRFFEVYARGVNAYLFRYRDKLPADLAATGYKPEYWKPEDSALIFCLLNFSQSANLPEEISSLMLAQTVSTDKLPWLTPSAPDEKLPLAEAEKLQGIKLNGQIPGLAEISKATSQLSDLNLLGATSSNNWAIGPQRSRSGKSLLASDSHGPLGVPSLFSYVQIRAPKYQASGVTIAGLPMVLGGFNGKVAWSMTTVMGDNQDLFLEKSNARAMVFPTRSAANGSQRSCATKPTSSKASGRFAKWCTKPAMARCSTVPKARRWLMVLAWPCRRRTSPMTSPWTRFSTCPAPRPSRKPRMPAAKSAPSR